MARTFNLELSMREAPDEAQARAATALKEPARAVGLRLTKRGAGELSYRARIKFPLIVSLYHNLSGEQMTVKFDPSAEGGTRVTIDGKVAGSQPHARIGPGALVRSSRRLNNRVSRTDPQDRGLEGRRSEICFRHSA